ncbi:glycoside hydrolase family 16 protein [Maricaulis parjimensis]|uniref:glycoside hydrolase family 16 protein n=1 Tax=Maricaulis parjimensis TaxID=144023 RepID=UPI00193A4590|nr:glycoside hydrolase family 16 protein [Maricaulis parjimensis]
MISFAAILAGAVQASQGELGPESGWELVWQDEFEGESIDPARWGYDVDCWGGGNAERQCYTPWPENSAVRNGHLEITARREMVEGPDRPADQLAPGEAPDIVRRDYTSARLVTRGRAAWRYGRIAVRAELPRGQGVWPAIWMLPEDNVYGGWALSGEIDIMEAVNLGTPCEACESGVEDRVLGTLHYGGAWPENVHSGSAVSVPDAARGFHVYEIEWSPAGITWLVDGEAYARQTPADWHTDAQVGSATPAAPFDQAFHLVFNIAIGGHLAEDNNLGGVSIDGFPKVMRVDWVRVYACPDGFTAEGACPAADSRDSQ